MIIFGLKMQGKEFNDLLNDKETKKETNEALYNKDFETLKHLKMKGRN